MEIFPCEHTLTLVQKEGIKIAEKSIAKCNDCDLSSNLWLCLTCGNLSCGRKETGGNQHAIEHYNKTKHPLVVKTGTITPDGEASLYCYACDNDVKDENLAQHLQNLGIDINTQKKTDKTVTEMNLSININFTLSKTIEEGKVLTPLYGPGFTGLENLGNSCYMNSVLQVLFSLEPFKKVYYDKALEHLNICSRNAHECYLCQMSKIMYGLHSGIYSQKKTRHLPATEENRKNDTKEGKKNPLISETLNSMFPPKQWEEDGHKYIQYVSPVPATREKSRDLFKALDQKLKERRAKEKGICPVREELYSQCFDEIIRQVTIDNAERGLLLLKVRDEIKMSIASYQILYESANLYGIRKQLQAEDAKMELKKELEEKEKKNIELTNKKIALENKLQELKKHFAERKEIEANKREKDLNFLNQQRESLEKIKIKN